MFTFLLIVQTLIAVTLIGVILMQRSEGGGLGVGGSSSGFIHGAWRSRFSHALYSRPRRPFHHYVHRHGGDCRCDVAADENRHLAREHRGPANAATAGTAATIARTGDNAQFAAEPEGASRPAR